MFDVLFLLVLNLPKANARIEIIPPIKIPIEAKLIVSKAGSNSKSQNNIVKTKITTPDSKKINQSHLYSFPLLVLIKIASNNVIEIKVAPNRS